MSLLQQIARSSSHPKSPNNAPYRIGESSLTGGGLSCFATSSLQPEELLLEAQDPVASVVVQEFRKEVCAWCFSYDFGTRLRIKVDDPKGRSIARFCQSSCHDAWMTDVGSVGWEAISVFEGGIKTTGPADERGLDSTCDQEVVEKKWNDVQEDGMQILAQRRANPRFVPKTATLPAHVDVDDGRFMLSAMISFYKSESNLQRLLELVPTLSPYTNSSHTLMDHVAIYKYMLSILPTSSPILQLVTPANIVTVVTRDAGNSWGIWDKALAGHELFAYCLYPTASYFNHSCDPNVHKERVGRTYVFRCSKPISEGKELLVSYLGGAESLLSVTERRKRLLDGWSFLCSCSKCSMDIIAEKN